jgi:hypothetical protein
VKNLTTGDQQVVPRAAVADHIKRSLGSAS